jgi:hypothetical protein
MKYSPGIVVALVALLLNLAQPQVFSQATEGKTQASKNTNGQFFNDGGYVRGVTTARVIGIFELLIGISSLVCAVRSRKPASKKLAKAGATLGWITVMVSIVHLAVTAGAIFGSGSGKAGSILAFLLGVSGSMVSWQSLRSRHNHEEVV